MHDLTLTTAVMLCVAAALAGWVDAVVGGGGLLQVPALLIAFPHLAPAFALGTNKAVGVVGTSAAAVTYARRATVDVRLAARLGGLAALAAVGGAFFAAGVNSAVLRPVIMALLLAVAAFVVLKPQFGQKPSGSVSRQRVLTAIVVVGAGIGFYDGLLGPGTGTFLVIGLVALLNMDMVTATATAKVVNVGTNLGALAMFTYQGTVLWTLAPFMALFNLAGASVGARMALKRGSGFVRGVMLVVVVALVGKLAFDQWGT
ncbi:sulfite exporter TauE/SafE family protein [Streptomyces antnestii]|uniref:Probable membrane transporter protein n=1 Tax=Streptomyces antnestii TaxID=2494256 RepID=A0A437Q0C5_9ACTN|nr:TSUP family transporter [Streptomyces sp. San01]RVU27958.1 sulfite exporter TauE/SafE family protein [Streptomyces sp. San01]